MFTSHVLRKIFTGLSDEQLTDLEAVVDDHVNSMWFSDKMNLVLGVRATLGLGLQDRIAPGQRDQIYHPGPAEIETGLGNNDKESLADRKHQFLIQLMCLIDNGYFKAMKIILEETILDAASPQMDR